MDERDVEAIYDALDDGRPADALQLAREALAGLPEEDPVLCFLAGRALIELDRLDDAARTLARAVSLDPDDAEFRTDLAEALYLCCRFDEAAEHARQAVALDEAFADAHFVMGLLLERTDRRDEAERHFGRASELDGERFPTPWRVDRDEFAKQLEAARAALPEAFGKHLDQVGLLVEDLPSEELLFEETPPLTPELLGLFTGVPLDEKSHASAGGELPPRIYLFKRNLERNVRGPADLAEQIRVTLYHELGHYLGLEEDDLEGAGFA
jgi:predicted Zn-dependent protease with MMP-like domain